MRDEDKSREDLLAELIDLRGRVASREPGYARGLILDSIAEHVVYQRPDHTIVWANRAAVDSVGATPDEIIGRKCYEVWQGRSQRCDECPVQEALDTGRSAEGRATSPDGRVWQVRGYPVPGMDGQPLGAVEVTLEVSERERARRALEESEALFRGVAEYSPSMIFINRGGRVVFANAECERAMGYSVAELTAPGFDFMDLIAPESREAVGAAFARHQRGEELPPYEYVLLTRDGRRLDAIISSRVITVDGEPALLGVVTDITERKRTELALRESQERYRLLVETSPDGIAMTTPDGRFLMANHRLATMHGYADAEELLAAVPSIFELLSGSSREAALEGAGRLAEQELVTDLELEQVRADGSVFPAEHALSLIRDEQGEPQAVLGVLRDVTERHRAEEERRRLEAQVQQAQKLESLGVLAGGIAHDFNNLLMGVLGNVSLAMLDVPARSPVRDALGRIEQSARRAAELTRNLLAYSGKGSFVVGPVDLTRLVREMAELLRVGVSRKVSLQYDLTSGLPAVVVDATQVRQLVMNLVTNASEAIGGDVGVVSVSTGAVTVDSAWLDRVRVASDLPPGDYVVLEVQDTGCGMDAHTLEHVFDPFFTTKFTGRGLGMAAALGIARGHGGTILVDTEVGVGSTFTLLLPAFHGRPLEEPRTPERPRRRMSGTVLLVDDEETVLETTGMLLEELGFTVICARDGVEALEVYRDQGEAIDVVLLDMTMPRMDGGQTFRELKRLDPEVVVVLSSGYNESEVTQQFGDERLGGFVQKPYTLARLAGVLERALGRGRRGG